MGISLQCYFENFNSINSKTELSIKDNQIGDNKSIVGVSRDSLKVCTDMQRI